MSRLTTAFAAVALAALQLGCAPTLNARLAGHYKSADCEAAPNGQGGQTYFTRDFTLTQTTWALDFSTYGDASCTTAQKQMVAHLEGPYGVHEAETRADGATPAEFQFSQRTITPQNAGTADYFKSSSACGATDWTANTAKDVNQSGCPAFGLYPGSQCTGEFDVVRLDDNGKKLFFGQRPADGNLCSADRRPAAVDATPVIRQ